MLQLITENPVRFILALVIGIATAWWIWGRLGEMVSGAADNAGNMASGAASGVGNVASGAVDAGTNLGKGVAGAAVGGVTALGAGAASAASAAKDAAVDTAATAKDAAVSTTTTVTSAASSAAGATASAASSATSSVKEVVTPKPKAKPKAKAAAKPKAEPKAKAAAKPKAAPKAKPAAKTGDVQNVKGKPKIAKAVGKADDLTRIKGIGPKLNDLCQSLGVKRFDQISTWKKADVVEVDGYLKIKGRIDRDEWVKQAKLLAKGDDAGHAKKYAMKAAPAAAKPTKKASAKKK